MHATMTAYALDRYGPPEAVTRIETAIPEPKPNEVRVRVLASGATRADAMMRRGLPRFARPFLGLRGPRNPVIGSNFSGVVDAVGARVTRFRPGQEVFGMAGIGAGANAEFIVQPEDGVLVEKPAQVSHAEAAALSDGPATSLAFLDGVGGLRAGQEVLIVGASGSLGTAAVQIAKARGARVTAVTSGANAEFVRELGADEVIDYVREDFTQVPDRFDVVFDTIGVSRFSAARRVLKPCGRYLSPVLTLGTLWDMVRTSRSKGQRAIFAAAGMAKPAAIRAHLEVLLAMIAAGQLDVVIERTWPLDQIVAAHRHVETGHKRGNVVLTA